MYVSTNPWKVTATFQTASSTRTDYLALIESLKASAPQSEKKSKIEQAHVALIQFLESRIVTIDAELAVGHILIMPMCIEVFADMTCSVYKGSAARSNRDKFSWLKQKLGKHGHAAKRDVRTTCMMTWKAARQVDYQGVIFLIDHDPSPLPHFATGRC